jgi:hypothetical protein
MTKEPAPFTVAMAKRIEMWPLDRLVPYDRNSRVHSPEQIAQVAASIAEFGFVNPILVDSNAGIIAGHGRLAAARELGMSELPVVVLDHLSERQRRAYVIADNKLALNASWDVDMLALEVDALRDEDFNLDLLGFSEDELKGLTEDGWASDIEAVEKHEENLDGIQAKIVVKLDGTYKDEVIEAIRMYCDSHAISVEIG